MISVLRDVETPLQEVSSSQCQIEMRKVTLESWKTGNLTHLKFKCFLRLSCYLTFFVIRPSANFLVIRPSANPFKTDGVRELDSTVLGIEQIFN